MDLIATCGVAIIVVTMTVLARAIIKQIIKQYFVWREVRMYADKRRRAERYARLDAEQNSKER